MALTVEALTRSCSPIMPGRLPRSANRRPSSSSPWTGRFSTPTTISSKRLVTGWRRSRASTTACLLSRPTSRASEYREFWAALNRGEYQAAEYKRIGKGGKEVWIQASYNPILDPDGKPFKVVKFATDMTAQKLHNADYLGQIAAIGKSQAVIEFKMDGTVAYRQRQLPESPGLHAR